MKTNYETRGHAWIAKKKKTKSVKPTKSQLKKKADKLFSLLIRKRGSCERCLNTKDLQAAHMITRANLRLRYDTRNVRCLCKGCHFYMHHHSMEFFDWYNVVYKDEAEYIREHRNEIRKMRIEDYEKLIKKLSK